MRGLGAVLLLASIAACGDDTAGARDDGGGRADDSSGPPDDAGEFGGDDATAVEDAPGESDEGPDDAGDAADGDSGADDGGVGCVDDEREEDDSIAEAMAGSPIMSMTGRTDLAGLAACPGDDDYFYAYSDCCGDPLGVEVTWDSGAGTLDVELLGTDGAALPADEDVAASGSRRLLQTATETGGGFVVRVTNGGAAGIAYGAAVFARVYGD